jgi:hypothetical protein
MGKRLFQLAAVNITHSMQPVKVSFILAAGMIQGNLAYHHHPMEVMSHPLAIQERYQVSEVHKLPVVITTLLQSS